MAVTGLTKTQMISVIEDDIIDRSDKSTLVGYSLDWALSYLDRTAAAHGFAFSDLNSEEITTTTISCTFETTDVDTSTNVITTSIDIPTGTKIVFTAGDDTGDAVPTGLTAGTDYWAIRGSSTTITVASTYLLAWQGTAISLTATGTGTSTVTAYRERLAKPDECRYIYDVRLIDGSMSRKLIGMTPRVTDLYNPFGAQNSVGRPTHYCEWKDWLQLDKIPDATYVIKIRYYKWQTAFATVASTAEIENIDDIIINAAAMYVWKILGEPEQAAIMENAVETALMKCGKLEKLKPDIVLKSNMGTYASSNSDTQSDPMVFSQR